MVKAMQYWVDEFDIDGYRCDYADGVPGDFWSDVITALRSSHPDFMMLAESIPGHSLLVAINTTGSVQTIKTPITLAGSSMKDVINNREVTVPVTIQLEPYGYNIIMN